MKKLSAIICILLAIFLGMYVYKTNIEQKHITASEVEKIEEFVSKIYLWQEISEEALPKFNNINEASELWVWEVVKKNLEQYELTYNEIQEKAIEIFGEKFTKYFPKEGSDYILYDENSQKYIVTGIGLDPLDDMFLIKKIRKINNGYEVEIIEYLEDYSDEIRNPEGDIDNQENEYNIYIKNLNMETIVTIKSNENESTKIDSIKENIDKFSTKTLKLIEKKGKLFVESIK